MYRQRDIVWTNFQLPSGEFKPHMAVIVSRDELHEQTDTYYYVLISSKRYHDEYCYELTNDMLLNMELDHTSQIVCHILSNCEYDTPFIRKCGQMKKAFFDELLEKIKNDIFG
ncbi:MAG: type II toxin-antitoxin system PemK/MazF family toxin [Bacteroidales bacterium]|nr:type II toxin-antitoxin system PemK/MazF family toxin [Bacteroidales bacterium]